MQTSTTVTPLRRPLVNASAGGNYTGLGERYLRRCVLERRVPFVKVGGRLMFDLDDLDRFIASHRQGALDAPEADDSSESTETGRCAPTAPLQLQEPGLALHGLDQCRAGAEP
jgi:excisionase family DNA binding protein